MQGSWKDEIGYESGGIYTSHVSQRASPLEWHTDLSVTIFPILYSIWLSLIARDLPLVYVNSLEARMGRGRA